MYIAIRLPVCLGLVVGLIAFSFTLPSSAQTKPSDLIEPGDLLLVRVDDLNAMGRTENLDIRVDDEGKVSLPLIRRVAVSGMNFPDAAKAIGKLYIDNGYFRTPKIEVSRTEESAQAKIKPAPIAAGEHVSIRIYDFPKPGTSEDLDIAIDADGNADLPKIGKIKFAGLKECQAEDAVADALQKAKALKGPIVLVRRTATADHR
jgi:protein involved in polysaccharide export with SLBB domain